MQFGTWDPFSNFFGFFSFVNAMFIIVPIFFVVIFIVIFVVVCRGGARITGNVAQGLTVQAPSFVIPESQRGQTRSDGTEMTTVRLPERCPSCGATISQGTIDWVGPLEAKCNYCGGTLRARFERV